MQKQIKYLPIIFGQGKEERGFYFNYVNQSNGNQHQIFITDPFLDVTGRFDVDPITYYGVDNEWLVTFQNGKMMNNELNGEEC